VSILSSPNSLPVNRRKTKREQRGKEFLSFPLAPTSLSTPVESSGRALDHHGETLLDRLNTYAHRPSPSSSSPLACLVSLQLHLRHLSTPDTGRALGRSSRRIREGQAIAGASPCCSPSAFSLISSSHSNTSTASHTLSDVPYTHPILSGPFTSTPTPSTVHPRDPRSIDTLLARLPTAFLPTISRIPTPSHPTPPRTPNLYQLTPAASTRRPPPSSCSPFLACLDSLAAPLSPNNVPVISCTGLDASLDTRGEQMARLAVGRSWCVVLFRLLPFLFRRNGIL
jgi:hypothetical protein